MPIIVAPYLTAVQAAFPAWRLHRTLHPLRTGTVRDPAVVVQWRCQEAPRVRAFSGAHLDACAGIWVETPLEFAIRH